MTEELERRKQYFRFASVDPVEDKAIECVVDLDDFGELVGVEVLPFRGQSGASVPLCTENGAPRWSYDPEVDGFYLRLGGERAGRQESVAGVVSVSAQGEMVALSVFLGG